jgi:thiamine-monophosphate kinase
VAIRKGRHRIQEFALIRALARRFARKTPLLIQGIGDDAAVIATPAGRQLVLTTDLLAEGIHFDLRTASFEDIGYKAAIANLSDIAAMGARPEHVLVALAIPASCTESNILRLYKGLMAACRPYKVSLIGGDTSASSGGLFLSLTVTGTVPAGSALLRSGAQVGDLIYVTGTIGDSLAGLQLLSRRKQLTVSRLSRKDREFLIARHRHPIAHCRFGQLLNTLQLADASIDLSDGLSGDLRHLCEESLVGAEIHAATLPLSSSLLAYARTSRIDPMKLALQGGEDYELLFTVPPSKSRRLHRVARQPGRRVTCIGVIRPRRFGIQMRLDDGTMQPIPITSYEHFQ